MARSTLRPRGPGAKLLALLCSSLLACTTVRTHVSTIAPEAALREGHATVQLDLWVESNRPLTPEEEARYRADARQALEQAIAGRSQTDGGGALVIRSLGVTRTPARRTDQTGAAVGIAVGAVAIVTLVILALVADGKGGGGRSAAKAPRSSPPTPRVSMPRASPPAADGRLPAFGRPPRFTGVPTTRPRGAPAPRGVLPRAPAPGGPRFPHAHGGPAVDVGIGLQWWIPLGPGPDPFLAPPPIPAAPPRAEDAPAPEDRAQAEAEPPAPAPRTIPLQPPEGPPVDSRGFFDGDRLVLDAVMVDPATGAVLWTKRIARSVDPRDAKAVRAAVDALLADEGWTVPVAPRS